MTKIEEIDFDKKGWLRQLAQCREEAYQFSLNKSDLHHASIQSVGFDSGLIFGHPLISVFDSSVENLPITDRIKIIYFDLIFHAFYFQSHESGSGKNSQSKEELFYPKLLEFHQITKGISVKNKTIFNISSEKRIEYFIDKRAIAKAEWYDKFWLGFFYNIILFGDILLWIRFINSASELEFIAFQMSFKADFANLLKVISKELGFNEMEKNKINLFIEENLDQKRPVKKTNGKDEIQDLIFASQLSNLEKNFFHQIAILAILAIGERENNQNSFIKNLAHNLEFSENQTEGNQLNILGFIMHHWKKLRHIQTAHPYMFYANQQLEILQNSVSRNKDEIKSQISESQFIKDLMGIGNFNELTWVDKDKIKKEIIRIIHSTVHIDQAPENAVMFIIAHLTEIIPTEMLPPELVNIMGIKRKKRPTFG